jgi:hypothetical protein
MQCYDEYGVFNCGGASLAIKVARVEACPYYFTPTLLKLALKSRSIDASGSKNELGSLQC